MIWLVITILSSLIRRLTGRQKYVTFDGKKKTLLKETGEPVTPKRTRAVTFRSFNSEIPESYVEPVIMAQRKESMVNVEGSGKSIAVLTSGGDAQGMNAAVRAVVRMGIYAGARVYAVYWGYQGLVDGGDNIKEMDWDSVSNIIQLGGTVIGSARCKDFRTRDGRRKAALNLITKGITNLVVIGGDGSLTGADLFRKEWPELLSELVAEGKVGQETSNRYGNLNIVGMVGSIDNDFCGTDMTIGADSALHRIIEAIDAITVTAESHQRAFVVEVMGRHCGYLALAAGIGCGADWIFIPECPPEPDWETQLCDHLKSSRANGRLSSIIIVSEGATDRDGKSITASQVKNLLCERLGWDTRVTVLGHVQRGGAPSAFDRLLSCRLGAEAALTVLEGTETSPSYVICLEGNRMARKYLNECVEMCNKIKEAYNAGDFKTIEELRGRSFKRNLEAFHTLKLLKPPKSSHCAVDGVCEGYNLAVMNVGAPAGGMNPAVRAFVRSALCNGHSVWGIKDGFDGLMNGEVEIMGWHDVDKWSSAGGSNLGTTRTLPSKNFEKVAKSLEKFRIKGLLIIGGFEAYHATLELAEARHQYRAFNIPIVNIPATLSNNVPGTHFSLGADTTLNVIVESIDRIKQSASSSQDRVFMVEVMGGKCGYLATMAAIAGAADAAYIFEEKFGAPDLLADIQHLVYKFKNSIIKRGVVLRSEGCSKLYTSDFITAMYEEEAQGTYITRKNVLGHVQQGGPPSPFDRLNATRQAMKAMKFLEIQIKENTDDDGTLYASQPQTACVLGIMYSQTTFRPVQELKEETDFTNRLWHERWWFGIRPLLRILARHKEVYTRELVTDS